MNLPGYRFVCIYNVTVIRDYAFENEVCAPEELRRVKKKEGFTNTVLNI